MWSVTLSDKHNRARPRAMGGLNNTCFLHHAKLAWHLLSDCKRHSTRSLLPRWSIARVNLKLDWVRLTPLILFKTEAFMMLLQQLKKVSLGLVLSSIKENFTSLMVDSVTSTWTLFTTRISWSLPLPHFIGRASGQQAKHLCYVPQIYSYQPSRVQQVQLAMGSPIVSSSISEGRRAIGELFSSVSLAILLWSLLCQIFYFFLSETDQYHKRWEVQSVP